MHEMINTDGEPTETLNFKAINIRNHGTMTVKNGRNRRMLDGEFLQVYGGGQLLSTNLHIAADVVIVDSKGSISVDGEGFPAASKFQMEVVSIHLITIKDEQ